MYYRALQLYTSVSRSVPAANFSYLRYSMVVQGSDATLSKPLPALRATTHVVSNNIQSFFLSETNAQSIHTKTKKRKGIKKIALVLVFWGVFLASAPRR